METQQQISALHTRQLELSAIMATSDDHAAKCVKRGVSFREAYPGDYASYEAANAEYNANEQVLAELHTTRSFEEADELVQSKHI